MAAKFPAAKSNFLCLPDLCGSVADICVQCARLAAEEKPATRANTPIDGVEGLAPVKDVMNRFVAKRCIEMLRWNMSMDFFHWRGNKAQGDLDLFRLQRRDAQLCVLNLRFGNTGSRHSIAAQGEDFTNPTNPATQLQNFCWGANAAPLDRLDNPDNIAS